VKHGIVPAMPEPISPDRDRASERTASTTALGAARLRAAHLLLDDPPPILDDPLALRLLDPAAAHAIHEHPDRLRTPVSRALRCEVLVRSRYAEDRLADAVGRGVRKYALLGAGLDTFAYRKPAWAADLCILEVDHDASQRDKQAGCDEPGSPCRRICVMPLQTSRPTLWVPDCGRPAWIRGSLPSWPAWGC